MQVGVADRHRLNEDIALGELASFTALMCDRRIPRAVAVR
jgi:hypothetical protein